MADSKVKCGDCRYFVRNGNCGFLSSKAGRNPERPFAYAPFWVWSDCYSDKEQVRADVSSLCPTFAVKSEAEHDGGHHE